MSLFKKSLGRSSGSKLKSSASSTTLPPWMLNQQGGTVEGSSVAAATADERQQREEAEARAEAERRQRLNVNRYAAGGGGAPAFTQMRKQEQSRVEKMQNQTFTRWVNLQLAGTTTGSGAATAEPLQDLVQGLASGENLLRLLAVLSGKNPSSSLSSSSSSSSLSSSKEVGFKKTGLGSVGSRFQSMGKVEQAFTFMKEEKIPLVGIGPQDISQGNLKLILGMMWSIIQHYRLADLFNEQEEEPAAVTASVQVTSGEQPTVGTQAMSIQDQQKANVPSTMPEDKKDEVPPEQIKNAPAAEEVTSKSDKKKDKQAKKEKKEKAKDKKAEKKGKTDSRGASQEISTIKAVQTPEPVVAQQAKPLSQPARVTQQSLENALLDWARDKIASSTKAEQVQVRSVKELFADGRTLPALVNAIVPGSVDVNTLDVKKPVENNKLALNVAAEKLEVPKLIDGEDLASGADLDGLSLILYLSYLKQAASRKVVDSGKEAKANSPASGIPSTPPSQPQSATSTPAAQPSERKEVEEKVIKQESKDEDKAIKEFTFQALSPAEPSPAIETTKDAEAPAKPSPAEPTAEKEEDRPEGVMPRELPAKTSDEVGAPLTDAQRLAEATHVAATTEESEKPLAELPKIAEVTKAEEVRQTKADVPEEPIPSPAQVESTPAPTTPKQEIKEPETTQVEAASVPASAEAETRKQEAVVIEANAASGSAQPDTKIDAAAESATEEPTSDKAEETEVSAPKSEPVVDRDLHQDTAQQENGHVEEQEKQIADQSGTNATSESLATESESSIKKKKKKAKKEGSKKAKKAKKEDSKGSEGKKKKKKKKTKKESTTVPSAETEVVPNGKPVDETPNAVKPVAAPAKLPHSRIPVRNADTDLSPPASGGSASPLNKAAYKVAAIPERKPKQPVLNPADDPVSSFWYS